MACIFSYVPEQLDLVGGRISPTSQALGEKYQSFVREHNPDLAKRVETHFLEIKRATSWKKERDRGYSVSYEF